MASARGAFRLNLEGHLELVCDLDARGQTRLARQSFRAPVHLSKPFWEKDALVLNVVSPTAGLLEGDRVRVDVTVKYGARLVLSTPAATRIHTMRGGAAEVTQSFKVESGASLEVSPEMLIPQRAARYLQRTLISLEEGAELMFFERLAPGRTAAGETFAYDELRWETDLQIAGCLTARERLRLSPGNDSLAALRRQFPAAYYGSALIVAETAASCVEDIHALHGPECWVGISALAAPGAFALKVVAADSLGLRRTMDAARRLVYAALGRPAVDLRRAGG